MLLVALSLVLGVAAMNPIAAPALLAMEKTEVKKPEVEGLPSKETQEKNTSEVESQERPAKKTPSASKASEVPEFLTGQVVLMGNESKKIAGAKIICSWEIERIVKSNLPGERFRSWEIENRVKPYIPEAERQYYRGNFETTTDNQGKFHIRHGIRLEPEEIRYFTVFVHAVSRDGKLAGSTIFSSVQEDLTIAVQPATEARGRLLDADGKPMPDRIVTVKNISLFPDSFFSPRTRMPSYRIAINSNFKTDDEGYFLLKGLMVGSRYSLQVPLHKKNAPLLQRSWFRSIQFAAKTEEVIELGNARVPSPRSIPLNPTRTRIRAAFEQGAAVNDRYQRALQLAQRMDQRVLIVFSDPIHRINGQLYENIFRFYPKLIASARNYQILLISTTDPQSATDAKALAKKLNVKLDPQHQPTMCVVDTNGKLLVSMQVVDMVKNRQIDRDVLLKFLRQYEIKPADPEKLLADALAKAYRENKDVLIEQIDRNYSRISLFLDKHAKIVDLKFVRVQIDAQRMENSEKVNQRLLLKQPSPSWWHVYQKYFTRLTDEEVSYQLWRD